MPNTVVGGIGRGGPLIQAPFAQMGGLNRGGGGGGYGSSMYLNPYKRRLGAAPFGPELRDQGPQSPEAFDPYSDKPYGRGEQEAAPQNYMMNAYAGFPGVHPAMVQKDQAPRAFRGLGSIGRGGLQNLSDSFMRLRLGGRGGGMQGYGTQGFGEGYQSDALKRLLMARLGDGGF